MVLLMSLPLGVLIVGGMGCALLVALGGWLAMRALLPTAERDTVHTIAGPLMSPLGTVFAIFMALSLATEANFLASAQGIVGNEAADASRLAWAATSPGVKSEPIQSALLDYLQAIRAYEWHGPDAADGNDAATKHAIASLENAVRIQAMSPALGTPTRSELLDSLDALSEDRGDRLAAASHQLPTFYVIVLLITGAALIVDAAALALRSSRRSAMLVGMLAIVIGLSLALLFALGTPWLGPITVSGQPIDNIVQGLKIGYFQL